MIRIMNKWALFAYNYNTEDVSLFATFSNRNNALQVKKALNRKQKNKKEMWYFIEKIKPQKLD